MANPQRVLTFGAARWPIWLLVALSLVAYSNSFRGVFVFDDKPAILQNAHLRQLWPVTDAMAAPKQTPVAGRPVLALTLAINYALNDYRVGGYHAVNLAIHLLAGLTLYGLIRRTLMSERLRPQYQSRSGVLAAVAAAVWIVHPIQTESVTYVIQRAESLVGLFYLLTVYAAMRSMDSERSIGWSLLAATCSIIGMASKEVMVTAPVMVLLYDRAFAARSIREALRKRWPLYAGLAASWLVLFALMLQGPRTGTVGFGLETITAWEYASSQFGVILHYLRLCLFPMGLCLDYGWPVVSSWMQILPAMLIVVALSMFTFWGLIHQRRWSYPAAWFFFILAPTSSFVPMQDLAFEHRMYLPLAGLCVLAVLVVDKLIGRQVMVGVFVAGVVIISLTVLTLARNRDYHSEVAIWQSVVEASPDNPRGHNNLGKTLHEAGRVDLAMKHYRAALRIESGHVDAHNNMGVILARKLRFVEAIKHFRSAVDAEPEATMPHYNLGMALQAHGDLEAALKQYLEALALSPDSSAPMYRVAWILATHPSASVRDPDRAVALATQAVALTDSTNPEILDVLAAAYAAAGNFEQAVETAQAALALAVDRQAKPLEGQILMRLESYRRRQSFRLPHTKE